MCDTCGCNRNEKIRITKSGSEHAHNEAYHTHENEEEIRIEKDILHKNKLLAEENRKYLKNLRAVAINMVSAPGSGKTSIIERSIKELKNEISFSVIEGDQQTMNDAKRIEATGAPVVQINTAAGCHLDAHMTKHAMENLDIKENSIVIIENVGNLVCPAMFDLGETKRVVVISTTEGEDKPLKYPYIFESANLCLINKSDLLPYLDFDVKLCIENAKKVNSELNIIVLSAKTGEGMKDFYDYLKNII